jgi:hypothetical protein
MNTVAKNLEKSLGQGCYATAYEIDGNRYIVTTGTGDGCFAYDADDVESFLDDLDGAEFDYNDFCQDVSPNADRDLAEALATHDVRICRGGSCTFVLNDAEYTAANSREMVGEAL